MFYRKVAGIVLTIACLLMARLVHANLGNKQKTNEIQQRIIKVEKNLVDLKQSINPFIVFDSTDTPKSILERMKFYKVPGIGMAIINRNEIEWTKSYGLARQGSQKLVDNRTMFEAASATKMIIACIVLHLVEKKVFDLDLDVNKYLQSWKIPENEFTRNKKVTLRLLLTHQAGLPETNFPQDESKKDPTLTQVLKGELPAKNKPAVVEFEPGSAWNYSNMGFVVIQKVLEDTVKKPLGKIAMEIILNR